VGDRAAEQGNRDSSLRRDLERLKQQEFDVLVVGAGIYGAWATLDAARRGLSVALVDQKDFGHATSANSQRIVHGGLRYLQHGDLKRMRESIRERSTLLRVAPHLVRPMPFLVPAEGHGLRSRLVLSSAVRVNDLLSCDRNRGLPVSRRLPRSDSLSPESMLASFPGFDEARLSGGVRFYDAEVHDSERMCLSILRSAREAGAEIANYVKVTRFSRRGDRVVGVEATDEVGGAELSIRARLVVGCTGPWTAGTLALGGEDAAEAKHAAEFPVFKAVVLVTRPVVGEAAVALAGPAGYHDAAELLTKGFRNFFVTPWRDRSLVGTFYEPHDGGVEDLRVTRGELCGYLDEFRTVCPKVELQPEDVKFVFAGLLPRATGPRAAEELIYAKQYSILDHERVDGVPGRITVNGVKWTTARDVAAKAVDLVLRRLDRPRVPCRTGDRPLHGGDMDDPERYRSARLADRPDGLSAESLNHLLDHHGTRHDDVLHWCREQPDLMEPLVPDRPTIRAQVVHAVRTEMAQTLSDVIFRRTALGTTGWPGRDCVDACAGIAAGELGWDASETARQIDEVEDGYERWGLDHGA
jgi:glycerol-3-phosphate dehydrogenase